MVNDSSHVLVVVILIDQPARGREKRIKSSGAATEAASLSLITANFPSQTLPRCPPILLDVTKDLIYFPQLFGALLPQETQEVVHLRRAIVKGRRKQSCPRVGAAVVSG